MGILTFINISGFISRCSSQILEIKAYKINHLSFIIIMCKLISVFEFNNTCEKLYLCCWNNGQPSVSYYSQFRLGYSKLFNSISIWNLYSWKWKESPRILSICYTLFEVFGIIYLIFNLYFLDRNTKFLLKIFFLFQYNRSIKCSKLSKNLVYFYIMSDRIFIRILWSEQQIRQVNVKVEFKI